MLTRHYMPRVFMHVLYYFSDGVCSISCESLSSATADTVQFLNCIINLHLQSPCSPHVGYVHSDNVPLNLTAPSTYTHRRKLGWKVGRRILDLLVISLPFFLFRPSLSSFPKFLSFPPLVFSFLSLSSYSIHSPLFLPFPPSRPSSSGSGIYKNPENFWNYKCLFEF